MNQEANSNQKIKILVDLYKIKQLNAGLGRFSFDFGKELQQCSSRYEPHFLVPAASKDFHPSIKAHFSHRHFRQTNDGFQLWHSLHQLPAHLPKRGTKWLLTIHDLNFLQEKNPKKAQSYLARVQKNVDEATAITCISNYTRQVVEQHIQTDNKPIFTIYNGIQVAPPSSHPTFTLDKEPFFFSIGIITAKKNFHVLLPVLKAYPKHQLIIAGQHRTDYAKFMMQAAKKIGVDKRVHLIGEVSEADKSWLYANCAAFLFPSLAEGFGMPVVEAMHFNKPIVTSSATSLPEIGGDATTRFTSFEPDAMIASVQQAIEFFDEAKLQKMRTRAQLFTWDQSVKNYLKAYESTLHL